MMVKATGNPPPREAFEWDNCRTIRIIKRLKYVPFYIYFYVTSLHNQQDHYAFCT